MKIFALLILFSLSLFSSEIFYLEDKNSSLSVESVLQSKSFLPLKKENSSFGFSDSTYWLKVILSNQTMQTETKILNFEYPLLDSVTLFKSQETSLVEIEKHGSLLKLGSQQLLQPRLTFKLQSQPKKVSEYYIKVKSIAPMNLDLSIYSKEAFENYKILLFSSNAFYIGAALVIILYNLTLFLFIKLRAYLYYVLFHTSFLFLILNISGNFSLFVHPQEPELAKFLIPFSIALSAFFQMLFAYEFLNIKVNFRLSKNNVKIFFFLGYSILFLDMILPYKESIILGNLSSFLGTIVPLVLSIYLWKKYKSVDAKYYTIAWLFFILGIAIEHLKNQGLIEVNFFTLHAMQMGALVEMVTISIALANRFNNLQKQNFKLNTIAVTDPLTKIKNRYYFLERTAQILASLKRKKEYYSLLMIDIDYFKEINDTYGHAAGDQALIMFTKTANALLREEDIFARIGGEEFVILSRSNKKDAIQLASRVKNAISEMEVIFEAQVIKFTISLGIYTFNDAQVSIDIILSKSDAALYRAKKNGRNTIEIS